MACERNRIIELVSYLETLGINVNIGKTKARGNRGIYLQSKNQSRIDISKNLSEENILSSLIHEFSHYIHYKYNKNLENLDFIFDDYNDDIKDELIKVTVNGVSKQTAISLFQAKHEIDAKIKDVKASFEQPLDIKFFIQKAKKEYPCPLNFLLKYDKVKYNNQIYSVDKIKEDFYYLSDYEIACIKLKSLERAKRRISSKINRINKYYNLPSELFARFTEMYFLNKNLACNIAPKTSKMFENALKIHKIKEFNKLSNILGFSV